MPHISPEVTRPVSPSEAQTLSMPAVNRRLPTMGHWTALVEVELPCSEDLTAKSARDVIEEELKRANALEARVGVMARLPVPVEAPPCPACGADRGEPCAAGCEVSR